MQRFGINGFGRIGRLAMRSTLKDTSRGQIVSVNNPGLSLDQMVYLMKYDSAHGQLHEHNISHDGKDLIIDDRHIKVYTETDPTKIQWGENGVQTVLECTGKFLTTDSVKGHLNGGAQKVLISAPSKDDTPMFVFGVNHQNYSGQQIISNASCTTNCVGTQALVLHKYFGIEEALMTTIHACTISQKPVDGHGKNFRIGRSCLNNIIPSTTGAAKAVAKVIPELKGKITGMAFRVPTINVSCVDLTVKLKTATDYKAIVEKYREVSQGEMKGIVGFTEDEIVSSDLMTSTYSSVFDAKAGIQLNDKFFKLISWYDNEYGYATRLVDLAAHITNN